MRHALYIYLNEDRGSVLSSLYKSLSRANCAYNERVCGVAGNNKGVYFLYCLELFVMSHRVTVPPRQASFHDVSP